MEKLLFANLIKVIITGSVALGFTILTVIGVDMITRPNKITNCIMHYKLINAIKLQIKMQLKFKLQLKFKFQLKCKLIMQL